ncbi:metal ABC transporter ATP-binding protein [Patescibacteria group bacterium]|nr:metal ABC transporter ATP-binding protein [Patescibacteria group bacterium]
MNTSPLIAAENLTVQFNGIPVLSDVSFAVQKGDFFAIIGPNGGGKTVLLKTLLGFISPSSGSVRYDGTDLSARTVREMEIGYVPQSIHFDNRFPITAFEVVLMGRLRERTLGKRYRIDDRKIAQEVLDEVNINEETARKSFSSLSGGQRQRVLIARALASKPQILFLDEPTASVDPSSNEAINALFSKLNKAGKTLVLVTHDIGAISRYISKVGCLNRKLFFHDDSTVTPDMVKKAYGCDIDLVSHGVPHRVLDNSKHARHD